MKKIYSLISGVLLVATTGCKDSQGWLKDNNLNIITPTGAPTLAFLDFLNEKEYETNTTVSNISAAMVSGSYKVAVMDLVGGVNTIKKGAKYKLSSVITFGNFYVYSTGNDENNVIEDSDYIVGFGGPTATPAYIFNNLYSGINIDDFVPGISDLVPFAKLGTHNDKNVDYFLLAEPALTQIMNDASAPTHAKGRIYANLQTLWKEKYEGEAILGAAIFIKENNATKDKGKIDKFLTKVKESIYTTVNDPESAKTKMNKLSEEEQVTKLGWKANIAYSVLSNENSVNLGYLGYNDEKFLEQVTSFLSKVNVTELPDNFVME